MLRDRDGTALDHGTATAEAGDDSALVPAIDIALPEESREAIRAAEQALSDHICRLMDAGLVTLKLSGRPSYSRAVKMLFLRSWAIAELLRSRTVLPSHVYAALSSGDHVDLAGRIAAIAGVEPDWLLTGAIVRPALIHAAAGTQPQDRIEPSRDLLRWASEAAERATRKRAGVTEIDLDDLVACITDNDGDAAVRSLLRRALREAADLGRAPAEHVKTRHGVEIVGRTVRHFRAETTERLGKVRERLTALDGEVKATTGALQALPSRADIDGKLDGLQRGLAESGDATHKHLEQLSARAAAGLEQITDRLGKVERGIAAARPAVDLTPVTTTLTALAEVNAGHAGKLEVIEQRTRAIQEGLRSPSLLALSMAVITVMAMGLGVAFLLGR